ncbi:ATP-binding protein [Flavitalea sp.]|nr:ATP-binding protein [Flavitalea sp.]
MKQCLIVFLLLTLSLPGVFSQSLVEQRKARNGVIDLRGVDYRDGAFSLRGEWKFYPDQLLEPDQIPVNNARITEFPKLWTKQAGPSDPGNGIATYALTILLSPDHPRLAFEMSESYCSSNLYGNNTLISSNGVPATTRSKSIPFWETRTINAPSGDTILLVIQLANFWHSKGGMSEDILIGERNEMYLDRNRSHALDLSLAGCLFMGGLFFLGLYIFGTKDRPILFFSLFCMIYSYRMIGTGDYVLHGILPSLPWSLTVHLEYLTLVTGVALFGKYTSLLYPEDVNKKVINSLFALCGIYCLIILVTAPVIFTGLMSYFLIVMFLFTAYAFTVYAQAMRNKRIGSGYALLSSGVMLLIFLLTNLQYFNIIIPIKGLTFALYVAFFFLQSLVLSHRFSVRLKDAADQAREGLRVKSEFLSTMSHEIRTPLNSVIGMAHLLQRNNPRKDQQESFEVLLFSANNLLSIVNNILDYNKIEAGKIHFEQIRMDVPAISKNILAGLKTLADEKRLQLVLDLDPRITSYVIGDPTRTAQVLNNLVHNGLKFTSEGSVTLSVKIESLEPGFAVMRFAVIDTGIGIPSDKKELIFERFTQADSSTSRRYGGTGLGLSISQKILQLQGTTLMIDSETGKGSTFSFTQKFPLSQEKLSEQKEQVKFVEEQKPLKGVDILLVEDNPMNVLVAQTFLERSGAKIDVATNGQEAIDKFDRERHRLILMDLDMPVLDGYQATRLLRKQGETVPIIALTASLPYEVQYEVNQAGLSDIMVKPFNPDELHRVIMLHLSNSSLNQAI